MFSRLASDVCDVFGQSWGGADFPLNSERQADCPPPRGGWRKAPGGVLRVAATPDAKWALHGILPPAPPGHPPLFGGGQTIRVSSESENSAWPPPRLTEYHFPLSASSHLLSVFPKKGSSCFCRRRVRPSSRVHSSAGSPRLHEPEPVAHFLVQRLQRPSRQRPQHLPQFFPRLPQFVFKNRFTAEMA